MHNKRSSEIMWTFLNALLITRLYDSPSSVNRLNAWCAGVCVCVCVLLCISATVDPNRPHASRLCERAGGGGAILCYGAKVGGCRWKIITLNICCYRFNGGGLVKSGVRALFQPGCTFSLAFSGWSAARITHAVTLIKLLVTLWKVNGAIK